MKVFIQFIKFGFVGSLGTVINLLIFFIVTDLGGLPPVLGSILAFCIAVTHNYVLNHIWTFKQKNKEKRMSFSLYIRYVTVCLSGLLINILVLEFILFFWTQIPFYTIAQALGILSGMIINFIGSKFLVFKPREEINE